MRMIVECSRSEQLMNVARWNSEKAVACSEPKLAERLAEQSENLYYQALRLA